MPALALSVLFSGYTVAWWGWTMLKDYDISLPDLVIPNRYKGNWPPPQRSTSITPSPFTVPNSNTGSGTTTNI